LSNKEHPALAKEFIENDPENVKWHDDTLWFIRAKRDLAVQEVPEWEALRDTAASIKNHLLSHLDTYLIEFEKKALENGIQVHWAVDAQEHNEIVLKILREKEVHKLVKSKSMLTEECGLNPYLKEHGIGVIDTDLGERIVQLANEPPSHIVMPAIHKKKKEIGEIFHKAYGTPIGQDDPIFLTSVARKNLRTNFVEADAAITGANFLIAETGGIVVCTNEGNADLGVNLAPLHIVCVGIEKLLPKAEDLGVFLRLLARSGTGQPITIYSSHFHKPRKGAELHIVLVDNGRSKHLGEEKYRASLRCIRCGACMNTCPVYRRSGGYSYNYTIPGPIGAILSPHRDKYKYSSLPFASTLCGSCTDVCPVKINIHEQLYSWRQEVTGEAKGKLKNISMNVSTAILNRPKLYNRLGKVLRSFLNILPKIISNAPLNPWSKNRDLPEAPRKSFKEWYKENKDQKR
jgi:L-lactate dehydrogenase complex protein LldF